MADWLSRIIRGLARLYRHAKFLWLNWPQLYDLAMSAGIFLIVFVLSFFLPEPYLTPIGVVAGCIAGVMAWCFWRVRGYLKEEAAYEDLRKPKGPSLVWGLGPFLGWPCSAVVLFAVALGLVLTSFGYGDRGAALRYSLLQVTAPLPPVENALRWFTGEKSDVSWPFWLKNGISWIYTGLVFSLVAAWFERMSQRKNYAISLFLEEDRARSPYGTRQDDAQSTPQEEPHEQVLLMKGERIGVACLPFLHVELSGPEWVAKDVRPDRCRGAIAVIYRIFGKDELAKNCREQEPLATDRIAGWLLDHLDRLLELDRSDASGAADDRLGESAQAVAAVLASLQILPKRPTPQSEGAYHDSERTQRFRGFLQTIFGVSPKRPILLLAACDAAERLGQPEDLKLLDQQTRRLDVQAGFSIRQTDRILQARDRVLGRENSRTLQERYLKRTEELGLRRLPNGTEEPLRFERPSDGAIMVLVPDGSFLRGDDRTEDNGPQRRIHLGAYLIDVSPVSQEAFRRWIEVQGSVLRMERGFFPVQSLPQESDPFDYAAYVTWFAAEAYARWAIQGGHLPSEAQWEKSVRGTTDARRYPTGNQWVDTAVSPFGVRACHMPEWARDAFDRQAYRHNPSVFDPLMEPGAGAGDNVMRVVRGRAPDSPISEYGVSNRMAMEPVTAGFNCPIGFRVAVTLKSELPS